MARPQGEYISFHRSSISVHLGKVLWYIYREEFLKEKEKYFKRYCKELAYLILYLR